MIRSKSGKKIERVIERDGEKMSVFVRERERERERREKERRAQKEETKREQKKMTEKAFPRVSSHESL